MFILHSAKRVSLHVTCLPMGIRSLSHFWSCSQQQHLWWVVSCLPGSPGLCDIAVHCQPRQAFQHCAHCFLPSKMILGTRSARLFSVLWWASRRPSSCLLRKRRDRAWGMQRETSRSPGTLYPRPNARKLNLRGSSPEAWEKACKGVKNYLECWMLCRNLCQMRWEKERGSPAKGHDFSQLFIMTRGWLLTRLDLPQVWGKSLVTFSAAFSSPLRRLFSFCSARVVQHHMLNTVRRWGDWRQNPQVQAAVVLSPPRMASWTPNSSSEN